MNFFLNYFFYRYTDIIQNLFPKPRMLLWNNNIFQRQILKVEIIFDQIVDDVHNV